MLPSQRQRSRAEYVPGRSCEAGCGLYPHRAFPALTGVLDDGQGHVRLEGHQLAAAVGKAQHPLAGEEAHSLAKAGRSKNLKSVSMGRYIY